MLDSDSNMKGPRRRAEVRSSTASVPTDGPLTELQRSAGNAAVARLMNSRQRTPLGKRAVYRPDIRQVIAQRLVMDKFNVVGETHDVSVKREEKERQFAKEETGSSNYWTETDFVIDGELADPPQLRVMQCAAVVVNALDEISTVTEDTKSENAIVQDEREVYSSRYPGFGAEAENIQLHADQILTSFDLIRRMLGAITPGVLAGLSDEMLTAVYGPWKTTPLVLETYQSFFEAASGDGYNEERIKKWQQTVGEFDDYCKALSSSWRLVLPDGQESDMHYQLLRSEAMKDAAEKANDGDMRGVWKIGDQHLSEIRELEGYSELKAHYESEAEFDAAFQEWKPKT